MAKRARGSVRPGQRRPIDRKPATAPSAAASAAAAPRSAGLTEAEAARAAELEQQLLAQERSAEQARTRSRERSTREAFAGSSGNLAVRAAEEYGYVARDLRRIGAMAVFMLAVLFGLWFLIDVAKLIPIGG